MERVLTIFLLLSPMYLSSLHSPHCTSYVSSMEGHVTMETSGGEKSSVTLLTWQAGLGETLCYKFSGEQEGGSIEVTYQSLHAVYPILSSYMFPLAESSVSCLCDCPGGSSQCSPQTNLCGNKTNCANYYNPSVQATGCFFNFLKISAAICCSLKVSSSN